MLSLYAIFKLVQATCIISWKIFKSVHTFLSHRVSKGFLETQMPGSWGKPWSSTSWRDISDDEGDEANFPNAYPRSMLIPDKDVV